MRPVNRGPAPRLAGIAIMLLAAGAVGAAPSQDPLGAYVQRRDPTTAWSLRSEGRYRDASFVELKLVSQTWQGIPWKHQLFIIRPAQVVPGNPALLFIAGGRWRPQYDDPPAEPGTPRRAGIYANLAGRLGAPVAVLLQVPHQPILGGLREDALIAYSLEQYLRTGDPEWPLLLPMTKAASVALDAVQATARERWQLDLDDFVVTGASKRGWTTWLAAAADERVVALAPMVFDVLDMRRQIAHQEATWGEASDQISDYKERDLPRLLGTPSGDRLLDIVDPWRYRERIVQPKLIILGTNDPYWPVDAAAIYYGGLAGDRNLLYLPNSPHSPQDFSRLLGGIVALQRSVAAGEPLPTVTGRHQPEPGYAALTVSADGKPRRVRVWYARSGSRDFRRARWRARPAEALDPGTWRLRVPRNGGDYVALVGEAEFDDGRGRYFLSTDLRITGPAGVEPLTADPGIRSGSPGGPGTLSGPAPVPARVP